MTAIHTSPKFKPGSIGATVQRLGEANPGMKADAMYQAVLAAGHKCAKSTVLQLRSVLGYVDSARSAAQTAAVAAKKAKRRTKKGVKRGPYKTSKAKAAEPATNGHTTEPALPGDSGREFRALVSRIGTDAADRMLAAVKQGR